MAFLMEVFSVDIKKEGDGESEIYGTICITDSTGDEIIYRCDKDNPQTIMSGECISLALTPGRHIIGCDTVVINLDFKDKSRGDAEVFTEPWTPERSGEKGEVVWSFYNRPRNKILAPMIHGENGISATVKYAVLSYAALVKVKVGLKHGDVEAEEHGVIWESYIKDLLPLHEDVAEWSGSESEEEDSDDVESDKPLSDRAKKRKIEVQKEFGYDVDSGASDDDEKEDIPDSDSGAIMARGQIIASCNWDSDYKVVLLDGQARLHPRKKIQMLRCLVAVPLFKTLKISVDLDDEDTGKEIAKGSVEFQINPVRGRYKAMRTIGKNSAAGREIQVNVCWIQDIKFTLPDISS